VPFVSTVVVVLGPQVPLPLRRWFTSLCLSCYTQLPRSHICRALRRALLQKIWQAVFGPGREKDMLSCELGFIIPGCLSRRDVGSEKLVAIAWDPADSFL
jgi:hypothetical protein